MSDEATKKRSKAKAAPRKARQSGRFAVGEESTDDAPDGSGPVSITWVRKGLADYADCARWATAYGEAGKSYTFVQIKAERLTVEVEEVRKAKLV